jgi:hypothetical protein
MTTWALAQDARRFAAVIACIAFAAAIAGCGGNSNVHSIPAPASITGNWGLTANLTSGGTVPIDVYLTSNAGSVSGIAYGPAATDNVCVANGCCGSPLGFFSGVALTGTVDASGNLKLGTPSTASNPAFAMTGTVSGSTLSNGSFTLSGTCNTQGTIAGIEYPPLDGTYIGTLTSQVTGQSFTMSITLSQSSAPNASGYLNLYETATVTGYPCIPSGTAMPVIVSSTYLGNYFSFPLSLSSGGLLDQVGTLSTNGKTLGMDYSFPESGSSCSDDYGSGTLTLQ